MCYDAIVISPSFSSNCDTRSNTAVLVMKYRGGTFPGKKAVGEPIAKLVAVKPPACAFGGEYERALIWRSEPTLDLDW